ncbi:MAG: type II secretion system F family protein [Clostridia bacterium]|nr:type II secretion system F family protein [Clostridia bacterium]
MAKFNYTAMDASGKETKGTVEAASREEAQSIIRSKGLTTLKLEGANALNSDLELSFMEKKPKPREMSVFCNQMVSVLSAGVGMADALSMIGEQTANPKLRKAVLGCCKGIQSGDTLADCMKQYDVFPEVFATMVAAGEETGSLEKSFSRMSERFEKDAALKGMIKGAMTYPLILLIITIVVVIIMLNFVVPKFQDTLQSMGTDLPALTKAVIAASDFMKANIIPVIIGVVVVIVGLNFFKKSDFGKHLFANLALKIPVVKNFTINSACANFARTLSTVIDSGVQLTDGLEITADTMSNVFFREAILQAKGEVEVGTTLADALEHTKLFPSLLTNMTKIGEETGNIPTLMDRVAGFYDDEVAESSKALTGMLEPLVIIVMAGIVGTIILAVMLPMASMYTAMDNL